MAALAHHRVTADIHGPADTTITIAAVYCSPDAAGIPAVKKALREEATKRGITLGAYDYVRYDASLEWQARVYGEAS